MNKKITIIGVGNMGTAIAQGILRKKLGLAEEISTLLVKQTLLGSAHILQRTNEPSEVLQKRVTSKGGTTEAAFDVLYEKNIARIIIDGVKAAQKRAEDLSR